MKKVPLVLAVLAASTSASWAQTQSGVTVYGIVDGGVQHLTGVRGGSLNSLVSGVMDGSRLGVRGTEDLGNGYKAIFTLENRTEIDTGSLSNRPPSGPQLPDRLSQATLMGLPGAAQPYVAAVANNLANQGFGVNLGNNFWDRQAYVGLITPVGAILAGRQYTPAYEINATYDIMNTQSSLSAGQVASFPPAVDIRISNAVQYRIQAAGFTGALMAAAGEGSATGGAFYGGMFSYKNESFSAGIGYNQRDNEQGQVSLKTLTFGASGTFGGTTVSGLYGKVKDDNPSGLSTISAGLLALPASTPPPSAPVAAAIQNAFVQAFKQDGDLYHIGVRTTFGPNTVYVATSLFDDQRPANADVLSYGVGYTYAFSKRTDANVILTHFDNRNLAQTAPGQAGFLGGVTTSAGTDSTSFVIGLRHRF
jgi:predicted porin